MTTTLVRLLLAAVIAIGVVPAAHAGQVARAAPDCGLLGGGAAVEAERAVAEACGLVGTPYSWGGGHEKEPGITYGICDPAHGAPNDCHVRGLDCSGFVRYAYALAVGEDIIDGTTRIQWQSSRAVDRFSRDEGLAPLVPGDLLFYGATAGKIHHVAMYLGDGWIVEAPQSGQLVKVSDHSRHRDYFGALRLFPGGTGSGPAPGADRVGYVDHGELWVAEGELGSDPVLQEGGVRQFRMSGKRIAVLDDQGALLVKEGDLGPGWEVVNPDSVTDFQLWGERIGYLDHGGLWVEEGGLDADPVFQEADVRKFQLHGDRVGVLKQDGTLLVKEGDLGPGWITAETGVADFQLFGARIGVLKNGELLVKDEELTAPWVSQEHGVSRFQLSGDRIAALVGEALLVKEGDLGPGWETVAADSVADFQLDTDRIAVLERSGELFAKEGDLTAPWVSQEQAVTAFQLDGVRIAVVRNGALMVKHGDLGPGWLTVNPDSVTAFQIGADLNLPTRL
ncbi:NlpC/P60 family protein [Saccharothrix carnea]|uniref:NlpC/P60 family protein n=1 Tax=Saccharothrix carnea TaxID=1280637 RepID=A0A2P8HZE9_SACCR|nr:C40 family peptidase [Saccharothrix carnea]PSL51581.1 NlpC/P60 family protein [Saccharothrix carnea]